MKLTPATLKELAKKNDITPSKKFGQNFMVDPYQADKIIREHIEFVGEDIKDKNILEVGPGLGSLTRSLLEAGAIVSAVEIDAKLSKYLFEIMEDNLIVINKDAIEIDISDFEHTPVDLISNLPYNVAVPIIINCLSHFPTIKHFTVLVQKEVAERLTAKPDTKEYGSPTVKLQYFGKTKLGSIIPKSAFYPVPRVESQLVHFERISGDGVKDNIFDFIDATFMHRRKTIRATLTTHLKKKMSKQDVDELLNVSKLDGNLRPENLTIDKFRELSKNYLNDSWKKPNE
jgi:16S rRNA (adenine1518-N6/adenine1519-N6)-dimethyltransferase